MKFNFLFGPNIRQNWKIYIYDKTYVTLSIAHLTITLYNEDNLRTHTDKREREREREREIIERKSFNDLDVSVHLCYLTTHRTKIQNVLGKDIKYTIRVLHVFAPIQLGYVIYNDSKLMRFYNNVIFSCKYKTVVPRI